MDGGTFYIIGQIVIKQVHIKNIVLIEYSAFTVTVPYSDTWWLYDDPFEVFYSQSHSSARIRMRQKTRQILFLSTKHPFIPKSYVRQMQEWCSSWGGERDRDC